MEEIGKLLKNKRQELSLSLKEISSELKVRSYYLELIENDRLNEVPSQVYTLGYLKLYAEYLGLNGNSLVKKFKNSYTSPVKETEEKITFKNEAYSSDKESIILVVTFFSIIAIIVTYLLYNKPNPHSSLQSQNNEINYILRDLEQKQTSNFKTNTTNMSFATLTSSLSPNLEPNKIAIIAKSDTKMRIIDLEKAKILEEHMMKKGEIFLTHAQPHLVIKTPNKQSLEIIARNIDSNQSKPEVLDIKIIEEKF